MRFAWTKIKTKEDEWEVPYGQEANSIQIFKMFAERQYRATTPCMRKVAEPPSFERGFPPHEVAPKLGVDETVELLTKVVGAKEEDPHLSDLFAALKTQLGFSDLTKPPPTISHGVELLSRDVKSQRGICNSLVGTYRTPSDPRVRTVPFCNVGDTSEAEVKS